MSRLALLQLVLSLILSVNDGAACKLENGKGQVGVTVKASARSVKELMAGKGSEEIQTQKSIFN